MIHIEHIKSSGYFQSMSLQKDEILFHEGDEDIFLYIIYDGELIVEKRLHYAAEKFKTFSHLGVGNIIGEGALTHTQAKQVQIRAHRDSILLKIDAKKDFKKFMQEYPEEAYNILCSIIDIGNNRILRANREITANYEINVAISKIHDFSLESIYKLLVIFQGILEIDQIMYFEKNLVMDEYFKLQYDSLQEKSIQNKIIKFEKGEFQEEILRQESIKIGRFWRYNTLTVGNENYGFIVIAREKKDFSENENKLLENISASFVAIIHQKRILDEERNKNYLKNS